MSAPFLVDLVEFAQAHPWIVALRVAVALALGYGLFKYRQLYKASQHAAAENAELIDNLTEGVYRSSPDGLQLSANRALVRLNGYETEAEQIAAVGDIGEEWYVEPGRRAEFTDLLERDGRIENFVSEIYRHKTRERIWISESARIVADPKTGEPLHYEGSVREITDSVRRREVEERFRKLTDMVPGGLFQLVRDPDGRFSVPYVSSGFFRTVGIAETADFSDPRTYYHRIHADDREAYARSLRDSGLRLRPWNMEFRVTDDDSSERWLHIVAQPEKSDRTTIWHGYVSDITVRKIQELEIEEMAYVDPLTGLPNRRVLAERMEQVASLCKQRLQFAAALFIDLDNFKELNDTHGHETGDNYLVQVADRLRQTVRDGDTVARIGGDEFLILLQSVGREDRAARQNTLAVAEKVMACLRQPYRLNRMTYTSTASIGVVIFDGSTSNVEDVIRRADQAMYEAKMAGRDTIGTTFADTETADSSSDEDAALVDELASAINQRELVLHFQPQIDSRRRLVGAEGYLRWEHPKHGLIKAARLVRIAGKAGLATDLDLVAMEFAVETLSIWNRTPGLETVRLAVNAGSTSLVDVRTVTRLQTLIAQHRICPGRLTIEVREQVQRNAKANLEARIEALKALGIRFSLDDFGSGYSSITYLKQLRFDEVKIEGAFVSGIEGNKDNAALVKTILAMAETLGITAVAEHVENENQEAILRGLGCQVFQGRHYADAMDGMAFVSYATSISTENDAPPAAGTAG
ncbi:MAG: EAL domain-containing protein [Rhizobiaceae bacterium]